MVRNNIFESYPIDLADYLGHDSTDSQVLAMAELVDRVEEIIRRIEGG